MRRTSFVGTMFKKLFGGSEKGGGSTSSSKPVQVTQRSTATTVDAIQKLGEVCRAVALLARAARNALRVNMTVFLMGGR